MQFRSLFLASMASSVLCAPVASPQAGLVKGLSPDVETLLTGLLGPGGTLGGLGLGGVPAPVGNVLDTVSDGLKKRQAGLVKGLSPDVETLLTGLLGPGGLLGGLGLGGVPAPVGNVLDTVSDALKKRQAGTLENLSPDVVALLNGLLAPPSALGGLGLAGISAPVGGVVTTLSKGLKKREAQAPGLLENLSPDVVALLNGLLAPPSALGGLGLAGISAPVGGVVTTLGKGLKKREAQAPGLLENLSPDVVTLLNGLLAPPSALGGLGLAGISAPVGGVVTTLGKGLKKREAQAPGLLENLSPDVVTLLNGLLAPPSALGGLGLAGISAPVGGVVTTLGKGLKQ